MTPLEWKALPELVRRQRLIEVGLAPATIVAITAIVETAEQVDGLPPRTLAAIRPRNPNGRGTRLLYFRRTAAPFLPKEYQ